MGVLGKVRLVMGVLVVLWCWLPVATGEDFDLLDDEGGGGLEALSDFAGLTGAQREEALVEMKARVTAGEPEATDVDDLFSVLNGDKDSISVRRSVCDALAQCGGDDVVEGSMQLLVEPSEADRNALLALYLLSRLEVKDRTSAEAELAKVLGNWKRERLALLLRLAMVGLGNDRLLEKALKEYEGLMQVYATTVDTWEYTMRAGTKAQKSDSRRIKRVGDAAKELLQVILHRLNKKQAERIAKLLTETPTLRLSAEIYQSLPVLTKGGQLVNYLPLLNAPLPEIQEWIARRVLWDGQPDEKAAVQEQIQMFAQSTDYRYRAMAMQLADLMPDETHQATLAAGLEDNNYYVLTAALAAARRNPMAALKPQLLALSDANSPWLRDGRVQAACRACLHRLN